MSEGMKFEIIDELPSAFNRGTIIKVFGVGGAGGNAVEHMIQSGVNGVQFVASNTDSQALSRCSAPSKLMLGDTGLGAGAKPEKGKAAAEAKRDAIRAALEGAHMVFITAGMGGGTGTGAAPVVAEIAREMGVLTVGVVTKPFGFEGQRRAKAAEDGIAEFTKHVDSLIVILNDKLIEVLGEDATGDDCFRAADDVLKNAVGGIAEIINYPGLMNVDFEDVRTVMSAMGRGMMGTAVASGVDRARIAAEQAVASPLLEGVSLSKAQGVLVNITGSKAGLKMKEYYEVMDAVKPLTSNLSEEHIIVGAVYDESMGDALRVTVVATGLFSAQRRQPLEVISNKATGTHDAAPYVSAVAHESLDTPAVIRRPQRSRMVGGVSAESLSNSGVEHFAIPAFLRKQAD